MPLEPREIFRQISIAAAAVTAVFVLTISLTAFVQTDVSTIYLAAVMFAAWRGGLLAGLVATLLSVAAATYFFLPPVYNFSLKAEGLVELIVFAAAAVVVGSLAASLERSRALERSARDDAEGANRVKDEFLATVSHELRTPLTTIKTLARLLLRKDPPEEKRREYLETISVECDRQIDLVLNLLDLSRIEGGVFRLALGRVDVREVIESCVRSEAIAAEKRQHILRVEPFGDVPPVCADPKALHRVLSNLIENSVKYTPDGGLITISAGGEGDEAIISVTDNGRGISAEDLPVLFEKFHRGRPAPHSHAMLHGSGETELLDDADVSGVGLGLYLARNIMTRMAGRISVETDVGHGSTFRLYLPLWADGACGREPSSEEKNGKEAARR